MIVVADASAVATFLLPDEAGVFADFARETLTVSSVHVPQPFAVEVATMISEAEPSITKLTETALRLGLTTYDASYLLLALSLAAPLLSQDVALIRAAAAQGIRVLAP